MTPCPAVFCGFQHDDPGCDPGITLQLASDEGEASAVQNWVVTQAEPRFVELAYPRGVDYDPAVANILEAAPMTPGSLGFRERRIAAALVEGATLLRLVDESSGVLHTTRTDYEFVRELLCSSIVGRSTELCVPLASDMIRRANTYLSVKLSGDRRNPFWLADEDGYRRSRESSLKRDAITRRELVDLGNVNSRMLERLIEYLQRSDAGYARYLQMGCLDEPIAERNWRRSPPRELARRLKSWSIKQVRTHFDRLHQRGLITAERQQANGPIHYEIPEELREVQSPYSQLPTVNSAARNQPAA